jgi:hypothetical protein
MPNFALTLGFNGVPSNVILHHIKGLPAPSVESSDIN